MRKLKRTAMIFIFLSLAVTTVNSAQEASKSHPVKAAKPAKKDMQPWEAWDKYREQMIVLSRQLGVTCTYCHDSRNYRDASKKTHQIAKSHMEMVDMINEKYKNSFSEKVDCYMCHKGIAKPEFIEKKPKF